MSKFPYHFFDDFIVRTPVLSCKKFQDLFSEESFGQEIYHSEVFKEAIFLASPSLYQQFVTWQKEGSPLSLKQHQKLKDTILKYFNRMSTRCTPFGLFAGVAVGSFTEEDDFSTNNLVEWKKVRDTKLDMHFLLSFSNHLASDRNVRSQILFSPNNSIYKVGNKIRYIEYEINGGKRDYIISSAPVSEELEKVLVYAEEGRTIDQLVSLLTEMEFSNQEIREYIEELVENQVLLSELEPNVAGIDFLDQLISILDRINSKKYKDFLLFVKEKIKLIDTQFGNNELIYAEIEELIKSLKIDYEINHLFQTDLYFQNEIKLPTRLKKELKKGISFLNKITYHTHKDNHLVKFKEAFLERFEGEEIALSFALDTDVGIGYRQDMSMKDTSPYLDDLILPISKIKKDLAINLNAVQIILNQKLQNAAIGREYVIKLCDDDFKTFENIWNDLPETMAFVTEIISENYQEKLYLNSGSGNAGRILARFCSKKSNITKLVEEICQKEEELNSEKILAEVIHLPESRIGNILRRPPIRKYEIPYLAKSLLPRNMQIPMNDLYVSIKNDKIVLHSRKLNKEINPCLTNAHNYSYNSLPVYHFLCDLSSQNIRMDLHFDWGGLAHIYNFLPRVEYGNLILSKAQWKVHQEEFKFFIFLLDDSLKFKNEIKDWRKKRQIPQWIEWVKHDNKLLINLENEELVTMFLSSIKNEKVIIIQEFLINERDIFTHQYIFSMYKNQLRNVN